MKRFAGLWRDTWGLWIALGIGGTLAGTIVSWIFFSTIPISLFTFFYFGLMRYDEEGNSREGL